jgi:hypothetical protein
VRVIRSEYLENMIECVRECVSKCVSECVSEWFGERKENSIRETAINSNSNSNSTREILS